MIRPVKSVRDLGVHLDSELTMKTHISKVVSLAEFARFAGSSGKMWLNSWFQHSFYCDDYCNSLLSRLPGSTIQPLQRVMNAAARVIMNETVTVVVTEQRVRRCIQIFGLNSALKQLHWLPVEQRIIYKLCLFMHYIHIGLAPKYLSDCVSNSFCSQWQISTEVHWLSGLRSCKNKNKIR